MKVFPDFGGTVGIKSEQLFEYDSEDSREWVRKNLYSLAEGFSVKLVKKIWFDNKLSIDKKIKNAEELGNGYTEIYKKTNDISVLLMAHKLWENLSLRIIADFGNEGDIIRIKNKELQSAKMLDDIVNKDSVLKDMISKIYDGNSVLAWSLKFLDAAPQKTYERMRNSLEFIFLCAVWRTRLLRLLRRDRCFLILQALSKYLLVNFTVLKSMILPLLLQKLPFGLLKAK